MHPFVDSESSARAVAFFALLLTLTACAGRPQSAPPPVVVPELFSHSGEVPAPQQWWLAFDDASLDRLVDRSLGANLDLQAAYERLNQARAVRERQQAGLFPSLEARAGAERRDDGAGASDSFSVGLAAEYELDLWGRIRAQVEAEAFRVAATRADYQTAALSLAAEVSNTWFQLLAQRTQRALARVQLQTNQDVLSLIRARFAVGQSASADVLRQRQLVEASREQLLTVQARIQVLEHQLAVLLGEPPNGVALPGGATLPALPPLPATGVPADLVRRRPDLRRAYYQLQAADAELAAAVADRFPRLTLSASLSNETTDSSDLFGDWLATLAGNLVMPLIDGGQRRAEARRFRSLREQRLYEYGQAALVAFQEVEDALIQERQQRRRMDSLSEQLELADSAYRQLRIQYVNGTVAYLDVLSALQERQDLRRTLITARQELLAFRVALYRALAGGFPVP
ncbi:MAG TPA: efflux transporter outer membrane subunit [Alcanivorax sp.]|nr:efflux transporter outer membrane subunit [Alcanivorax sp.]